MQGIETLGYEVVETNPIEALFSEGGIAQHQEAAEMLADFGRNGDTYIVHAAEGETVLPLEVLENNPRLKNMIYTQMEEMGLEPERYIVGNELNSLNPETGQPEFFFKALKRLVKKVVKVVKKIAPVVLAIAAPILLPAMPVALAAGLGSTAGNLIQGKSLSDSLKSGVVTGLTAGAGNMISGGSFLGSSIDPGNVAGVQDLGTMFTPDNPFTTGISANLTGVGADVAAGGGKVGGGVFKQDFAGDVVVDGAVSGSTELDASGASGTGQTSAEIAAEVIPEVVKPKTFIDGLKSAFTPGDDYGFGDFWSEFLSPGREGISAAAQEGYKTDLASFKQMYPNADAGQYTTFINSLDAKYAPGILDKFGPVVGTALAGGLASDTLLGTSFITPPEEEVFDLEAMQTSGRDLLESDPETYGIDDSYLGGNPYYETVSNMPVTTTPQANPGFTAPIAPIVPTSTGIQTVATDIPGAVVANPDAANQYAGMFGGDYFSQTPYSNISYFQPPVPSPQQPQFGINPPPMYGYASGGEIMGPGTPTSDSVPAMLSDGEFVMNARAVRGAGGGDRQQGAKRMYEMMRSFERTA
jgi:hypothetical protein